MNYSQVIKYTHLLFIVPLLLYVGCKGLDNEKVSKYIYIVLMILAVEAFMVHSGIINTRKMIEGFEGIAKGTLEPTFFSTGTIDRNDKQWFVPRTHEVHIVDYEFRPQFITVMKGDTVKWINHDNKSHIVKSYTDLFDSDKLDKKDSYSTTFDNQGVFNYFCYEHPYMKGSVSVVSAGHHPNVQDIDMDKKWNPYLHPLNQSDAF